MLAAMNDYIRPWTPMVAGGYFLVAILFGGWLMQFMLRRLTDQRRVRYARGLLIAFLMMTLGLIAGGVLYFVGHELAPPKISDEDTAPISWLGIVLAVIGFLLISYLTAFASGKLSAGQALKASAPAIGAILLMGVLVAVPSVIIANQEVKTQRQVAIQRELTRRAIQKIFKMVIRTPNDPPRTLKQMVNEGLLQPEDIRNQLNPEREIGFLYLAPERIDPRSEPDQKFLLVTHPEDTPGQKLVLFTNGRTEWLANPTFELMLNEDYNKPFAEMLKQQAGQ